MSLPEVEVLLATFNGARFLREQVDSLLAQDYGNLRILVRDDGSSDATVAILQQYAEQFPDRFRVMPPGAPSGSAAQNFLLLMSASSAGYLCFADQDDVWLPSKVTQTWEVMDRLESRWGRERPLLVFSDLRVVDDQLKTLDESFWAHMSIDPSHIERLPQLLLESMVTGCTAMINRPLLNLALRMPQEASMHDRWTGLVAGFLGKAGILRAQTVLYRQHEDNVLGTGRNRSVVISQPKRRLNPENLRSWKASQRDARAFLTVYASELPQRKRALLEEFLRCETCKSGFVRVATFVRYGFRYAQWRHNLTMMLYLWRERGNEP